MLNECNRNSCFTGACREKVDLMHDSICIMEARSLIKKAALNINHENGGL